MSWQQLKDIPTDGEFLCELNDIPDCGGFEVTFGEGNENFKVLLLRQDKQHWCYVNSCPHFSLPLNYKPQKFVISRGMVVCAHHTAFFKFENGDCVDGPCKGTGLTALPSYMLDEKIFFGSCPKRI